MDKNASLKRIEKLADLFDARFVVPGTNWRFGLDSLIGLVPGIGDTLGLATSIYIIGLAQQHDLPGSLRARMFWNVFVDWLIGLVPLVGYLFDLGWKANQKNLALLKKHLAGNERRSYRRTTDIPGASDHFV